MRRIYTIILLCFLFKLTTAQVVDGQEVKLFVANTLFGGISTGFGALVNKEKQDKAFPTFFKGFKYGCIGGVLLYTGKKTTNLIDQGNVVLGGWGAKLIHNAGLSIMENAILHRPVFSHYNLYVGFTRLEFDWQNQFSFTPKVMPITLAAFIYKSLSYNSHFDLSMSLKVGSMYSVINDSSKWFAGQTTRGNITLNEFYKGRYVPGAFYNHLTAHENVYVLQTQEHYIFNSYANKIINTRLSKNRTYNALSKFLYFDFNVMDITYSIAYLYAEKVKGCYWSNPYEFGAERMTLNTHFHIDCK